MTTVGEGGMVTTNDDALAARLRLYRGQGVDPKRRYWFPVIGYNYRMTNIQAAIGLGQMENVDKALASRQQLARWYDEALAPLTSLISLPQESPWAKQVFWMYTIFLKEGGEVQRDAVMRHLDAVDIETRPVFHPLHKMPPYFEDKVYPVADEWAQRGINLPTFQGMTQAQVERVAAALGTALGAR